MLFMRTTKLHFQLKYRPNSAHASAIAKWKTFLSFVDPFSLCLVKIFVTRSFSVFYKSWYIKLSLLWIMPELCADYSRQENWPDQADNVVLWWRRCWRKIVYSLGQNNGQIIQMLAVIRLRVSFKWFTCVFRITLNTQEDVSWIHFLDSVMPRCHGSVWLQQFNFHCFEFCTEIVQFILIHFWDSPFQEYPETEYAVQETLFNAACRCWTSSSWYTATEISIGCSTTDAKCSFQLMLFQNPTKFKKKQNY